MDKVKSNRIDAVLERTIFAGQEVDNVTLAFSRLQYMLQFVQGLFTHLTIPVPRNRRECLSTLLRCLLAVTFLSQKYSVLLTLVKRALSGEFVTHSLFCFLNLYIHSVEAVMEAVKAALHLCQQKNDYSSSSSSSFWKLHLE